MVCTMFILGMPPKSAELFFNYPSSATDNYVPAVIICLVCNELWFAELPKKEGTNRIGVKTDD